MIAFLDVLGHLLSIVLNASMTSWRSLTSVVLLKILMSSTSWLASLSETPLSIFFKIESGRVAWPTLTRGTYPRNARRSENIVPPQ
jgi:hypothetical protein